MLLTNTTTTGGDTGAHIAMPKYLESLLSHGHLTGWDPGWYDGFPLYTFYFTIPGPLHRHRRLDHPLRRGVQAGDDPRFGHAARLRLGLRPLLPASGPRSRPCWRPPRCRSCSTTPSPSTAATSSRRWPGSTRTPSACRWPCCFSASSRAPSARAGTAAGRRSCSPPASSRTSSPACTHWAARSSSPSSSCCPHAGDRRCVAAALAQHRTASSCPGPARCGGPARRSAIGLLALGLVAGALRAGARLLDVHGLHERGGVGPVLPRGGRLGARPGRDRRLIAAVLMRSRFGITVTVLGIASAVATAVDPQGSLYNVRLLPLWFISVYLMAAWAFGTGCMVVATGVAALARPAWEATARGAPEAAEPAAARAPWDEPARPTLRWARSRPRPPKAHAGAASGSPRRWGPAAVSGAVLGLLAVMVLVVPALHLPGVVAAGDRRAQRGHELVQLQLRGVSGPGVLPRVPFPDADDGGGRKRYGCGRAMWEYSASENRFGTPEALMLLPY